MRERQKKKGRTWAEAAKTVLEKYPNTPMSHKEILQVIQRERLKEISGTSPLACLNAMLHTNSRGEEGIFYKVPGRMGVYTLKDISEVATELSEEESEDSSDDLSDSRSSENNSGPREGRRRRWMRPVPSKLPSQQQPTSPQPRCSSPSVAAAAAAKLISPSQKHSKKALKQALKQQQQRNQRRQAAMPSTSSSRLLLKTIKDMADNITAKTDLCLPVGPRKVSQRSGRLSAGHLKRNRCKIDVETPDSILVNTNLRAVINKHTFSVLPPDCQQRLLRLLPQVDQQPCTDGLLKVTSSALNNEFFTSAAQSWKERLAEGEFTPELQLRMRQEIEKEKKVEHWKEAFFESYYGKNSGLSLEESKELTKADLKWEPKPRQPRPASRLSEEAKGTDDRSRTNGGAAVKDAKSAPSQEKTQPPPKECLSVPELMKTRRSQHAEDRRMPAPTSRSEPEKQNEGVAAETRAEVSEKEGKMEFLPSPVKSSPPPQAGMEVKEDPPPSGVKPSEETKAEPECAAEPQKRKPPGEMEDEATPEKRPRISSVSSVSSISSVSPPASSIPSPATPTSASNQRVPPLKIPVTRILPIPASPSQVSPRTPLPTSLNSPAARTGARTLADIKAKAQLARAQRAAAAAAAASGGSLPGSGSGAGTSEPTKSSPSPSLTSPHPSARLPVNTISATPSRPQDTLGPLSPSHLNIQDVRTVGAQPCSARSDSRPECQETPSGSTRISSCVPANNPLVTRLLQGKEVPLEQILPKPLTRVDSKISNVRSSKGKTAHSATGGGPEHHQRNTTGWALSDYTRHHKEPLDKDTQEQILQTLMERKFQQRQPQQGGPTRHGHQAGHAEEFQDRPWISVGFLGRKRTPRPAMSGHYLLNVSTYGRGSDSKRSHQAVISNVAVLKRETADGQEAMREGTFEFKMEQQGSSVSKCEQAGSLPPCPDIKTEPGFEDIATDENTPGHKQVSNQGKSEPYLPLKDPGHQQPSAFPTPRMSIHQESVSSRYGGTISVSVPRTLNRNAAGGSATVPDAGSVMSFSVTVTTIPAANPLDPGDRSAPPPEPSFMEAAGVEDAQSKCYCRLKAMIMCKGCGAFCHDDCIGPSELCVSCLVVR
ncbi:putative Polycomb group protein ASXL2 isoform X2 [Phyllopteryx taeniolatus]|uniref:putative Polycomb group protein ASXL2 isoform X2 n=1 Tax=Phyllopteryx taeniolatus TaxID=161469 RepID=UPI002AD555BD|nr:putative Polycomb group protein ASXL2 isoform X2 [Phyllopteryx taeniolatus]